MENTQYSDSEVISKILAGDPALFEILIRRYNSFLYKAGRAYNYSHDDTQDLMQESFIAAYIDLKKFEGRASFKTWILKIMLNKCWHRKEKASFKNETRAEITDQSKPLYTSSNDIQKTIMNRELSQVIEKALAEIPENYRIVFTLREISGLNIAETADALAITDENVKVRLNRAKKMLRAEIEKSYSKEDIFEFNLVYCDAIVKNVMTRIKVLNSQTIST
ncbi:MAG: sigma-70 family RNA polymerase sigma factor [Flavobacterium sp.]|nr:MAG: sigma-70 family RNA polymerase sigma factor [Flavobacterium sp.]